MRQASSFYKPDGMRDASSEIKLALGEMSVFTLTLWADVTLINIDDLIKSL